MLPRSITQRWKIHESTQRSWVRLAFVFGIFLPTLSCILYGITVRTPWYQAYQGYRMGQRLSQALGMTVTVARSWNPSPYRCVLDEVIVFDHETHKEILRVSQVNAEWKGQGWDLRMHQPTLQGEQLASAWRMIHDWYLCRTENRTGKVRLVSPQLEVMNSVHSPALLDLEILIDPDPRSMHTTVRYRQSNDAQSEGVRIDLVRHHDPNVPNTEVVLQSGTTKIPCSLLADYIPSLQSLGEQAYFQGTLRWKQDGFGQWEIRTDAQHPSAFGNIQGNAISSWVAPNAITGRFQLALQELWIQNGQCVRIAGQCTSSEQGGYIQKELLLRSTQAQLGRAIAGKIEQKNPEVWYTDLAMEFDLSATGLTLRGLLIPRESQYRAYRAMITTKEETLLFDPDQALTLQNLVYWLGGAHNPLVARLSPPLAQPAPRMAGVR